jgi:serine/threonine protein kinase
MGEVYRARDTRLKREVAIKILPEAFAKDADRLARFQREAELLATLNHPNSGAVFGLEQADQAKDSAQPAFAIILELIEGDTLAGVLQHGPMPVERALNIARQIAEALEAAHEKGIVHRDLKPANIKITPDDKVKVLDFGLAKAMEASSAAADLTHSPTLSMMATQAGVVLGTAAYMSPEQAKGLPADQRSDVFAFGAVLYEMLTRRQPFQGDTAADLLASVIVREPDLNALPPNLNPRLHELLQRCLEKNPKKRWQAMGDVRAEIEMIAAAPHIMPGLSATTPPRPLWRRALPFAVTATVAAGITAVGVWSVLKNAAPAPRAVTRFEIPLSAALNTGAVQRIAISGDGRRIIYSSYNSLNRGVTQVYSRSLDQLDPMPLQGVTSAGGSIRSFCRQMRVAWVQRPGGRQPEESPLARRSHGNNRRRHGHQRCFSGRKLGRNLYDCVRDDRQCGPYAGFRRGRSADPTDDAEG